MFGNLKEMDHMRFLGLDTNLLFDGLYGYIIRVSDCTVWNSGTIS